MATLPILFIEAFVFLLFKHSFSTWDYVSAVAVGIDFKIRVFYEHKTIKTPICIGIRIGLRTFWIPTYMTL